MKKPLFLLTVLSSPLLWANTETPIELKDIPENILHISTELLEGFQLERAQIETEANGNEVYELIGIHEEIRTEIDIIKATGKVQEYEKELPENMVPYAVRKALLEAYPGIQFKRFEASFNEKYKVVQYEVEATHNNKDLDLEVSPNGRKIRVSDS